MSLFSLTGFRLTSATRTGWPLTAKYPKAKHTSKYRPWQIETYLAFTDHQMAVAFERYLKTSSGIAFARKRLRAS
jgi:hypothetical protein